MRLTTASCLPAGLLALAIPQLGYASDKFSAEDIALVNRITWGVNAGEMQRAQTMGIDNWLQAQLHPGSGDHLPPRAKAALEALAIEQRSPTDLARELAERVDAAKASQAPANAPLLHADGAAMSASSPSPPRGLAMASLQSAPLQASTPAALRPQDVRNAFLNDAYRQDQARLIMRDLYSQDQLREQMTAFWFNHFNVYGDKGEVRLFLADYEDRAIRPNALGNFRTLLEATLRSPAMLQYLDNAQNAAGHINENYAREIMELHTMGVGSGYSQKDVQELARILTGLGVANPKAPTPNPQQLAQGAIRDGMFAFYPARHDKGDKVFLGHTIRGSGYDEVRQALDILCAQPATARHVSKQIAQYFVADDPPRALVDRIAGRFSETHGDIAKVLNLLFHTPEFHASLRQPLLKDPQHYVLSAIRLAYDDRVIVNPAPVNNWLGRLAQPLYGHLTPDGYALERTAWNGPGQIEQRFEVAQAIGSGSAGLFKGEAPNAAAQPAFPVLQGALYYGGLGDTLSSSTQSALTQANSPQEWNIFFLASPDFMGR